MSNNVSYAKLSLTVKCKECGHCFKVYDDIMSILIDKGETEVKCKKCNDTIKIIRHKGKAGLVFTHKGRRDGRTWEKMDELIFKLRKYKVPKGLISEALTVTDSYLAHFE